MPKVLVQNEALEVELTPNENMRIGLKRRDIGVYDNFVTLALNCRGHGICGTCKVMVMEGRDRLSVPTNREKRKLGEDAIGAGFRLSCQAHVTGDCEIHAHP